VSQKLSAVAISRINAISGNGDRTGNAAGVGAMDMNIRGSSGCRARVRISEISARQRRGYRFAFLVIRLTDSSRKLAME
jgi:hypothetical protein